MKYSFIIIAYNEQKNIAQCIESIQRQKGIGSSYEIIVADDGSRDATARIVKKLATKDKRIKLIGDGKNHGRGYGRYVGVNASSGSYVMMIDADIVIPPDWLKTCLKHVKNYDAVGGTAVPDGDVAYIYKKFRLNPKTSPHTTTVSGGNGCYRRSVFSKASFKKELREGEDVDFNHQVSDAGLTAYCIPGLIAEHQESKSFLTSMKWLYQSGVGATRQLLQFKKIRLPDLAFFATLFSLLSAIVAAFYTGSAYWFIAPIVCIVCASVLHVRGKFYLKPSQIIRNVGAVSTNALLISCYYAGRLSGLLMYSILGRNRI